MCFEIDLSKPEVLPAEAQSQLNATILSKIADNLAPTDFLKLSLNGKAPAGIGSKLSKGAMYVHGDLGRWTANEMTGGTLYVEGNVSRLSNLRGGVVFVVGDIDALINICSPAKVCCTGRVGPHVFARTKGEPSPFIYSRHAPRNEESEEVGNWRRLSHKFQYLIKVRTPPSIPRPKPSDIPWNIKGIVDRLT